MDNCRTWLGVDLRTLPAIAPPFACPSDDTPSKPTSERWHGCDRRPKFAGMRPPVEPDRPGPDPDCAFADSALGDSPVKANNPNASTPSQPCLLDRVRDEIRVRHYSIRIEGAYVDWI